MIRVIMGNDAVRIAERLKEIGPLERVSAEEMTPQELMQPTLFSTPRLLDDYTAWTPAQRKRFVALDADGLDIVVRVAKLGGKDPLAVVDPEQYVQPTDRRGWTRWMADRATQLGVEATAQQRGRLLESVGENAWAIETELRRWAIDGPTRPMPLNETAVWGWVEALLVGDRSAAAKLVELRDQSVFILIGAVGQRLYTQTLRVRGADPEALSISPYVWRMAGESSRHGWDEQANVEWLRSLGRLETKCKGQGGRFEDPWPHLVEWQQRLLDDHPSRRRDG